jgi:hypothetical protein
MIEQFLCHGVHEYGSVQNTLCLYIYSGRLTDVLVSTNILLLAVCLFLFKLRN